MYIFINSKGEDNDVQMVIFLNLFDDFLNINSGYNNNISYDF